MEKADGYAAVAALDHASLVLIDPPRLETHAIVNLIKVLNEKKIAFLTWVPRTSRPPHNKGGEAAEADTSKAFKQQASALAKVIGFQWHAWGSRVPGCWLAISPNLEEAVQDTGKKLVGAMNSQWRVTR